MAYASETLRDSYVTLRSAPFGPGEVVEDSFIPLKMVTYYANIPDTEVGNEPLEGFAAFSNDGTVAMRGESISTLRSFKGFFAKKIYSDYRADPSFPNQGSRFATPICARGRICVYAATPIFPRPGTPTFVITSVPVGSSLQVGSLAQGPLPSGVTFIDVSSACRVKSGATKPNNLVLVDILIK